MEEKCPSPLTLLQPPTSPINASVVVTSSPFNKSQSGDAENEVYLLSCAAKVTFLEFLEQDLTVCECCLDGEVFEDNEIIFCDTCNVAVHQLCYNVATVPDGAW